MENQGAKGRASDSLEPGQSVVLLDAESAGIIRRIWMTVSDRSPIMLRGLRIECFWDGASRPAVSAPLGDFFGVSVGRRTTFESELFSDAEGRSFLCHVPMPFRKGARITLTNDTPVRVAHVFYDINYELHESPQSDWLYLHAHWRRERPTELGRDYTILPTVRGAGHLLGVVCGVIANPAYKSWFGEGEVKMYVDGDSDYPTLVGTGLEDYVGDAWGLRGFAHRYGGAPVCDSESGMYSFYRWHVPDPVHFQTDLRVTIQQIGCCGAEKGAANVIASCQPYRFVMWNRRSAGGAAHKLLEDREVLRHPSEATDGVLYYYRVDDYASCAFFYLDRPENDLPALAPISERVAGLVDDGSGRERADL